MKLLATDRTRRKDTGTGDYITVVGGVNVDIGGFSRKPLVENDSNPGSVMVSLGGVGRNVAHNLCLMGQQVRLVTVVGHDSNGAMVWEACETLGMEMSMVETVFDMRTSTYLFIADHDRDMRLAVADMDIYQRVTPAFLARRMSVINAGRAVVVDTNIPEESILYLVQHATVPVVADPVSGAKALRLLPALSRISVLKPNALEAGILTGEDTSSFEGICRAAEKLLVAGVKTVVISMGAQGVYYADDTGRHQLLSAPKVQVVNATGAGDAFTAGLCLGMLKQWDTQDVVTLAQAAAAIAIEDEQTVSPQMCLSALLNRYEEIVQSRTTL